jgi:hypothetical protein
MSYPAAMRKVALYALVLAPSALLSAVGCTAILGDFEVTANGPGGTDGSVTDGPIGGEEGGADGGTDANDPDAADAANTIFTTCGFGMVRPIEEIEDATMTMGFGGQLQIFRVNNLIRVIAQKQMGDGATIYTFDPFKNGNNGPLPPADKIDLQTAGRYLDARRAPTRNSTALLFMERSAGAPFARMKVIELPDSNPLGQSFTLVSKDFPDPAPGGGGGGGLSGTLGVYGAADEYFWSLGGVPSASSPGKYDLFIGYKPNAATVPDRVLIHTSAEDRDVRVRDMARSQTTQFIVNDRGPDNAGDPGSSIYAVPQNTQTIVAPKLLSPSGGKPFVVFGAEEAAMGAIRLAVAEVDFSSTNFGIVRAGTIPQSDLNASFDGTKIPTAFTLTSLTEVPAEGEARFFGPDMIWLGTPPDPLRGQGLNFIWYNTDTHVIRSKQTGMNRLLNPGHTNIERSSVVLATQTAVNADLDVVFVERVGTKSILQYGRLSCIR